MSARSDREIRLVLDAVGEIQDAEDLEAFRAMVLPVVRRIVPAEFASYNEIAGDGAVLAVLVDPPLPAWTYEAWETFAGQNPLLQHYLATRDGRAHRFSDVMSAAELRALPIVRELYAPMGVRHQLSFVLPSSPSVTVAVALSRGPGRPDFTKRECGLIDLMRPHLAQAYRNAGLREETERMVASLRAGIDALAAPVVVLDARGRVAAASARARRLAPRLRIGSVPPAAALALMRVAGAGNVLVGELAPPAVSREALRALGLTVRQAEVLAAFAGGESAGAIAQRLGVSHRTIQKHTEGIYARLGVRTREAAVAAAWAVGTAT